MEQREEHLINCSSFRYHKRGTYGNISVTINYGGITMSKKYFVIEIDSWSDETKIKEFDNKEKAIEAIEMKYVAAVLNADQYDDDETFINDHYAQFSNGFRTFEFRLAELEYPAPPK